MTNYYVPCEETLSEKIYQSNLTNRVIKEIPKGYEIYVKEEITENIKHKRIGFFKWKDVKEFEGRLIIIVIKRKDNKIFGNQIALTPECIIYDFDEVKQIIKSAIKEINELVGDHIV